MFPVYRLSINNTVEHIMKSMVLSCYNICVKQNPNNQTPHNILDGCVWGLGCVDSRVKQF